MTERKNKVRGYKSLSEALLEHKDLNNLMGILTDKPRVKAKSDRVPGREPRRKRNGF